MVEGARQIAIPKLEGVCVGGGGGLIKGALWKGG